MDQFNNIPWKIIDMYFRDNPTGLIDHHLVSYNESTGSQNSARSISVKMDMLGYRSGTNQPSDENIDFETRTGDSAYGYLRNDGSSDPHLGDKWCSNINTSNYFYDHDVVTYYRNADYDGTNDIEVKQKGEVATRAELNRAFKKHMGSKTSNKTILNAFIEQIA